MSAIAHDLVIRAATIVDGSGRPSFAGDVAVDGGRIVAVGSGAARGRVEIDGRDQVLAPGWIDTHTHLDANQFWDPDLSPCGSYGATTVVMSNCGYALAPYVDEAGRNYVVEALVAVEQVARDAIDAAVPFDWSDLASYVARLDALPTSLNRASLVGHLPVRTMVMGPAAARERRATPAEIASMADVVAEGLRLGAFGFSTDQVTGNIGPAGSSLPGQVCADDELLAIAGILGRGPGPGLFTMAPRALLLDREARVADLAWHERLAWRSGRPVVVGPIFDTFEDPGIGHDLLDLMGATADRGGAVIGQVSPRPFELWTRLDAPGVLVRYLPSLRAAQKAGGADGVRALAADPIGLERLRDEGAAMAPSLVFSGQWEHVHVRLSPTHPELRDQDVASIAATTGEAPTDVILRIATDDGFETQFSTAMRNPDDRRLGELVAHPAAQLGGSDAGAHTQSNTDSCYAVWTLQHWVRDRQVLGLERAVAKLTGEQADLLGLTDRGRITVGLAADLVLFDPDQIGVGDVRFVADQPAGGSRLLAEAQGITATIVAGEIVVREGEATGARPGRLLRAG